MSTKLFFKMLFAWILSLFIAIGSVLGINPPQHRASMMAHRGYSFKYPENTTLAFSEAAKHGAEGVETDLRITKDKIYVLCHDSEVVFEDNTKLNIAECTLSELKSKPLKNTKTQDKVYLCTLDEFLDVMKEYNLEFYLEFKVKATKELIKDVFTIIGEKYDIEKCIYESQKISDLITARGLFPDMPMMYVITDNETDYSECLKYNISVDVNYTVISKELVEEFHSNGLKAGSWTCDTRMTIAYSNYLGVDYIESNVYCE